MGRTKKVDLSLESVKRMSATDFVGMSDAQWEQVQPVLQEIRRQTLSNLCSRIWDIIEACQFIKDANKAYYTRRRAEAVLDDLELIEIGREDCTVHSYSFIRDALVPRMEKEVSHLMWN